jgi:segregation and condensation protein A
MNTLSASDNASQSTLMPSDNAVEEKVGAERTQAPNQPQVRDPERFTGHRVTLPLFEGPLDLLLYLIRAHRYDVCDIPIAQITRQFLDFVRLMDELDIDYAGEFLVTAATLMQIKARMLLPKQESANEDAMEAEKGNDPRQELVERLLEYQKYQEAADTFKEMREKREMMFTRVVPLQSTLDGLAKHAAQDQAMAESLMLQNVSSFDLLRALQRVLNRVAEKPVALVRREPFSLPERMKDVYARIVESAEGTSFGALCEDCESRLEVVITFLALLELIRRSRVIVEQPRAFEEIMVRKRVEPIAPDALRADNMAADAA